MKVYSAIILVLGCYISSSKAYSKYGRSCKDIGCRSNEVCVMENDPCSYYQRQNECGAYPTCKKTTSGSPTCATFVCPPGNVCKMSGDNPKCVEDTSKRGHVGYDTSSLDSQVQPAQPGQPQQPSAPVLPSNGGSVYPNIPTRGETTPRPNVRPQSNGGGGYRGGSIGSGYPGQPSGYPAQPSGYPSQPSGYPSQYPGGYPQQGGAGYQGGYNGYQGGYQQPGGYPQGGYQQPGGYPQGGYQGGSSGGYPYNSNSNQYGNKYGQKSSGSSFSDTFSNTLKNLGLFCCLIVYRMYSAESLT
ncbi:unnamed protein product [Brassicogethes aeneus]|uniref:Uncharacterized protein n=1 Tax=Brassicogethes aeneus TaxID=1431903 RepID=A0A9P0BIX6_BRAAE|nr:unnamed protein product [Brassicogethes aeneus]